MGRLFHVRSVRGLPLLMRVFLLSPLSLPFLKCKKDSQKTDKQPLKKVLAFHGLVDILDNQALPVDGAFLIK